MTPQNPSFSSISEDPGTLFSPGRPISSNQRQIFLKNDEKKKQYGALVPPKTGKSACFPVPAVFRHFRHFLKIPQNRPKNDPKNDPISDPKIMVLGGFGGFEGQTQDPGDRPPIPRETDSRPPGNLRSMISEYPPFTGWCTYTVYATL